MASGYRTPRGDCPECGGRMMLVVAADGTRTLPDHAVFRMGRNGLAGESFDARDAHCAGRGQEPIKLVRIKRKVTTHAAA